MVLSLILPIPIIYLLLFVNGQIHFYHTDRSTISTSPLFFDYLYYTVQENIIDYYKEGLPSFKPTHQIIPYCVRTQNKQTNYEDKPTNVTGLTFDYLQRNEIRTNDLLLWSASIDLVERYEEYINHPTNESSLEIFHNCTWPWFGSTGQYSFNINIRQFGSVVRAMFRAKLQTPSPRFIPTSYTSLSCYTSLKCTRGASSVCLDWREVCDGQADCYDDGIDEKDWFQLEVNQCEENEFQCRNGMCIPISFFNNSPFNFDCMDGTDEGSYDRMNTIISQHSPCFVDPAVRCEELDYIGGLTHLFCGDGQTYTLDPKDYCRNGWHALKRGITGFTAV